MQALRFSGRVEASTSNWKQRFSLVRESPRPARLSQPSGSPHFWDRADERLECARYSNVGIPAARSVSGEKLLHQHFAVGDNAGSARSVSKTVSGPRSRTHFVFETRKRFHF